MNIGTSVVRKGLRKFLEKVAAIITTKLAAADNILSTVVFDGNKDTPTSTLSPVVAEEDVARRLLFSFFPSYALEGILVLLVSDILQEKDWKIE